jgi:hypothetical protein
MICLWRAITDVGDGSGGVYQTCTLMSRARRDHDRGEPAIAVPRVKLEAFAAAAAGLAGADGIDAVAMRRLGKRCTTGMMTIYGYVTTKEDLSAVPADRDLTEIELPGWSATNALTAGPPTVASSVLSRVAHDQESRDRRGKPDSGVTWDFNQTYIR